MDFLGKIFEDKKIFVAVIKISLLFGPGFIAVGYFNQQAFIELDWLKLLSIAALFTATFTLPTMIVLWVLKVLLLWDSQLKLRSLDKHALKLIES